jgi:MFS superfamily sulfate permease-like transporter
LAKVASGLCGAFPTSSSFSRSALNLYAGAQSGWATLVSVAVILVILLFFTAVLQPVPQSVLAAIVVAAVLGLIKPHAFVRLYNINRVEAATAVVTFVITLLSAPRLYWGVLAGVVMGLSHFLHTRLHPRIIEVGLHPDGSLRDRHLWKLPPLAPNLYALRMDAELDFAAASTLERAVMEHLGQHPNVRHVCLFALPINRIDATGVESLAKLEAMLRERGISLHISGINRHRPCVVAYGCRVIDTVHGDGHGLTIRSASGGAADRQITVVFHSIDVATRNICNRHGRTQCVNHVVNRVRGCSRCITRHIRPTRAHRDDVSRILQVSCRCEGGSPRHTVISCTDIRQRAIGNRQVRIGETRHRLAERECHQTRITHRQRRVGHRHRHRRTQCVGWSQRCLARLHHRR